MPGCRHFRVEIYHKILLLGQLRITGLDLGEDPVAEAVPEQGVRDIHYPLLRELEQLFVDRHVLHEFLIGAAARHDVL